MRHSPGGALSPSVFPSCAFRRMAIVLATGLLPLWGSGLHAQSPGSVTISAHPTDGAVISVDGRLDEDVWAEAPAFSGFIQSEPVEGAPAENDTEVRILYGEDAMYIGLTMYDEAPETIARSLSPRNTSYSGQFDLIEVMLDPTLDRRTGYRFHVTAANVQGDAYLFNDTGSDSAWNAVWESAVRIHDAGWTVEMRIPFSQIRYESGALAQSWGINVQRRRAADNEVTSLSPVSRLIQGNVSQFGRLEDLRVPASSRRVELRPYLVTRAHTGPASDDNPFFDGQEFGADSGFDLSYGLGSSFTLDATVNPDFGQVEADPAVINLSALETFLPEQRPFFVEDARIFDFSLSGPRNQIFYSRRIGRSPQMSTLPGAAYSDVTDGTRILGAAKLTGRTPGGLSLGVLGALTSEERGRAFFRTEDRIEEFVAEPRTAYGVVRVRQELRDGDSTVGAIVGGLTRALPDGGELSMLPSEAVSMGMDFEHTWSDREWALLGFFSAAHVRGDSAAILRIQRSSRHYRQRPDLDWSTFEPGATGLTGGEWRLELERRRGSWRGSGWVGQVLTGYDVNDLGFNTNMERVSGGLSLDYREVTPGSWYRDYSVRLFTVHDWSHEVFDGDLLSWDRWRWAQTRNNFQVSGNVTLPNFWSVGSQVYYNPDTMSRRATRGGPRMVEPGARGWSVNLSTDSRAMLSLRPSLSIDRGLLDSGNEVSADLRASLQPSTWLEVSLRPSYTRTSDRAQYVTSTGSLAYEPTYGTRYLFGELELREFAMEARMNWTFTPHLTFQLFAQPLLSAGDYVGYRQLSQPESFEFEDFAEGEYANVEGGVSCLGGRSCLAPDGTRWVDFDGSGTADFSFADRDFNVRSLRSTAVLRWEYRPGSALYFAWQRRQAETVATGEFDLSRDLRALLDLPSDNVFIIKANLWTAF